MYSSHQSRERVASGSHWRALFELGQMGGHERGTHATALLCKRSMSVQATKRSLLTLAAVVGVGCCSAMLSENARV
jgi:hypothetical protein